MRPKFLITSSNLKLETNKKLRFSVVDLAPPFSYTAFPKIIKAFLTIITVVEFSRQRHHSASQMALPTKICISPQGNFRSSPGMPTAYFVNRYVQVSTIATPSQLLHFLHLRTRKSLACPCCSLFQKAMGVT